MSLFLSACGNNVKVPETSEPVEKSEVETKETDLKETETSKTEATETSTVPTTPAVEGPYKAPEGTRWAITTTGETSLWSVDDGKHDGWHYVRIMPDSGCTYDDMPDEIIMLCYSFNHDKVSTIRLTGENDYMALCIEEPDFYRIYSPNVMYEKNGQTYSVYECTNWHGYSFRPLPEVYPYEVDDNSPSCAYGSVLSEFYYGKCYRPEEYQDDDDYPNCNATIVAEGDKYKTTDEDKEFPYYDDFVWDFPGTEHNKNWLDR